jgi:serine/threonine protein kinase
MELSQLDARVISEDCPGLVISTPLKIGGQKRVWQCAYQQRAYVLKALMGDDRTLRRVRREIEVMHVCESRYLPKFGPLPLRELQLGNGQKILYFLEEYIDGVPLDSVYKPMLPEEVVSLGLCVSEALSVLAAKRYVHRDVKPMNIIQRSPYEYVLIDAGLALDPDAEAITAPGAIVGTKAYLSPDQIIFPPKQLDVRSDLFSLGVTLYESAAGEHPFINEEVPQGDIVQSILSHECVHPHRFNPTVPNTLCEVVLKLLQKDRRKRYSTVLEVRAALSALRQQGVGCEGTC